MNIASGRAGLKPLNASGRKLIRISDDGLVNIELLNPEQSLPVAIKPATRGVSLAAWVHSNVELVENNIQKYGAVLFRDFEASTQQDFEDFLTGFSLERMNYMEGATPRKKLGEQVYTSTEFPAQYHIALHNELSYVLTWPMKVCFFCVTPPSHGGETPIADVRKVLRHIPDRVRQAFVEKGWMLVRNFGDGLSLTWQNAFRTESEKEVEDYCMKSHISCEWRTSHRLRTRQIRPAVTCHPKTGESVWFNHVAFWHHSSLDPKTQEFLLKEFGEEGLPYNTYYGDGSRIDPEVVEEIRKAYDVETVAFPWQTGDLLMTDNMLAAHGRCPFEGPRKIIVSMGEPFTRIDI